MHDIASLDEKYGLAGEIRFAHDASLGTVATIHNTEAAGTIALNGGQVLAWQPVGEAPVLWRSPERRRELFKPERGGIPVCWPWFAQHPSDPTKPFHGFARIRPWRIVSADRVGAATRLTLALVMAEGDRTLWPHPASLTLTVTLGRRLRVELVTHNTGPAAFTITQALHTYFAVGDIGGVRVEGLDGCDYLDKVDGFARKRQQGPIAFAAETDRIYLGHHGTARIVDEVLGRRIDIGKSGSASTVVWNPWVERSAAMGDMGPDGYRAMVCVETANAADDARTLAPGEQHALVAELSLADR